MVKGISKQVIVVNSADRQLFEQAIFILSDEAIKDNGVSNERLLKEANRILRDDRKKTTTGIKIWIPFLLGAAITGAAWLLSIFL